MTQDVWIITRAEGHKLLAPSLHLTKEEASLQVEKETKHVLSETANPAENPILENSWSGQDAGHIRLKIQNLTYLWRIEKQKIKIAEKTELTEPLILRRSDWTETEFESLRKLFSCPDGTDEITVTFKSVSWRKNLP